ncbi:MAG: hypothetical protein UV82_C0007G0036 [Candidatus Magasanikbacteria bacterium GW2011_GWD2_43_18]|uniref:Uncharacterized protein n=1 Tax=Candidatus Magasanikbacteria bacterium GW2011_GWE2_42_7 TaxID=1619052 RepID=A0A0G1BBA4_9BACT|nr:MAG: hypothetical protein UV42_C0048G0003 [Candidatus Magasanikbacteria bacterium GW2011_GWE2_42_7]KKT04536.1 MAG: hypothetical protein UV82_C0007G0036 [Candidatus Magasanikbacteria bacterium GW2011_GWD2_43_18]
MAQSSLFRVFMLPTDELFAFAAIIRYNPPYAL